MTAATVEETPPRVGDVYLETFIARQLAAQLTALTVDERRSIAARAVAERRQQLGLYRMLLLERYDHAPSLARIEADDAILVELELLAAA